MQIYATDGTEAGAMPSGTGVIGQFSQSKLEETKTIRGGSCCRFPSLNIRLMRTPTPSNTPNKIPHATAEPNADRGPPEEDWLDKGMRG